jgi:hypothetical protein
MILNIISFYKMPFRIYPIDNDEENLENNQVNNNQDIIFINKNIYFYNLYKFILYVS